MVAVRPQLAGGRTEPGSEDSWQWVDAKNILLEAIDPRRMKPDEENPSYSLVDFFRDTRSGRLAEVGLDNKVLVETASGGPSGTRMTTADIHRSIADEGWKGGGVQGLPDLDVPGAYMMLDGQHRAYAAMEHMQQVIDELGEDVDLDKVQIPLELYAIGNAGDLWGKELDDNG